MQIFQTRNFIFAFFVILFLLNIYIVVKLEKLSKEHSNNEGEENTRADGKVKLYRHGRLPKKKVEREDEPDLEEKENNSRNEREKPNIKERKVIKIGRSVKFQVKKVD